MKQDVSKKSIRLLSEQTAGSVGNDVSPPSNSFFIQQIKCRYAALIAQAELNMQATQSDAKIEKYRQQKKRYKSKLTRFKQVLNEIPDGFSLAQTMYTRIPGEQNKRIEREFSTYARPRFMIYLAEKHEDALKKIGLCSHSIKRMKTGLDPADKEGRFYNLTVDHVIERSGSGRFGYDKSYDKKTGQYMRPTYKVNHFANLMLMPDPIHTGIKNVINDIQDLPALTSGQKQWSISLVPTGDSVAECSVYVPKNKEDAKQFIHKNKRKTKTKIGQIIYLSRQLDVEAQLYLEFSGAGARGEKDIASKKTKKNSLAQAFNGREQSEYIYKRRVVPLLKEMTDILYSIDRDLQNKQQASEDIRELTGQLGKTLNTKFLQITETRVRDVAKFSGTDTGAAFIRKRRSMLEKYLPSSKSTSRKRRNPRDK